MCGGGGGRSTSFWVVCIREMTHLLVLKEVRILKFVTTFVRRKLPPVLPSCTCPKIVNTCPPNRFHRPVQCTGFAHSRDPCRAKHMREMCQASNPSATALHFPSGQSSRLHLVIFTTKNVPMSFADSRFFSHNTFVQF